MPRDDANDRRCSRCAGSRSSVVPYQWGEATNSMTLYPDSPDDLPSGLQIPLWSWDEPVTRVMSATRRRDVVDQYFQGFRLSDHSMILAALTDDVVWVIHGHRVMHGKAEFDKEIENPAFVGSPELAIQRVLEDGYVVVTA
jgi:hypothetical protein